MALERNWGTCVVSGCEKAVDVKGRGLCYAHYRKLRLYGDPEKSRITSPGTSIQDRFNYYVEKSEGCWNWTGSLSGGYGAIWDGKRSHPAHRISWELVNGPIPEGIEVDHQCHNKACVRPSHLRPATSKQNKENLRGPNSRNRSGFRGVAWNEKRGKWQAAVQHNKKKYYLGLFDDPAEAGAAAALKRADLFTHSQN